MSLARARRWDECAGLAARWLEAAPLSADAALFFLNSLKAEGTREADGRSLVAYERLTARMAREFGLAPDKTVTALAESIRGRFEASAPERTEEAPAVSQPTPPALDQGPPSRPSAATPPASSVLPPPPTPEPPAPMAGGTASTDAPQHVRPPRS